MLFLSCFSIKFKEIFLDTGLCNALLGLTLPQINAVQELVAIHKGALAEQITGQLLRTLSPPYIEPTLYCWHREVPGSNAEIDYLITHHTQVIPIEVKSGATGSLKSLHLFMNLKKAPLALRIYSEIPKKTFSPYPLLSLPFYLIGQISRFLDHEFNT